MAKARQLQPSNPVPQRAPGTRGRRCASYPDVDLRRIGKSIGISSTYAGRILNGHSRPSMGVAQKVAKLMGWTLDQVNGLYQPKPKTNTLPPDEESFHGKSRNSRERKQRASK